MGRVLPGAAECVKCSLRCDSIAVFRYMNSLGVETAREEETHGDFCVKIEA